MGTHPIFESDFDCLTERTENVAMDLPKTAPKRKEIDIYIDQKNQIEPTIKRIKNKIQSLDKIRDIICVLHGIGPDGCDSVGSISMKLRNELSEEGKLGKIKIGNPHIELWHGLPTLHCAIQKA